MNLNRFLSTFAAASLTILLSACGGGAGSSSVSTNTNNNSNASNNNSSNTTNNNTQAPTLIALPRVVNNTNWKSPHIMNPQSDTDLNVEVVGTELLIEIKSDNLSLGNHVQIYLDTDNKAASGFQFEGQAWTQSGVDYIIEDGDLFKSTANDTSWSWDTDAGDITYAVSFDKLKINIDLALLGDICNSINVGVMTRDHDWDIATFYPISARMQSFKLSYCSTNPIDTQAPVITLNGANPLSLEVGSSYNELGAKAIDNIDGDISADLSISSNVNTAIAGTYLVEYYSKDMAGNAAKTKRKVVVTEATPQGITVDGDVSDWASINTLVSSSNGFMKVTDDAKKLYILVSTENLNANTQIFMDSDNKASTGLDLASHISTWKSGADYMIENDYLDKSTSNTPQWSWDYGIADIEFIRAGSVLEVAIKKSDFEFLGNKIPMAFMSRDENWNLMYQIPDQKIPVYTLLFPTNSNQVKAFDDSATVTHSGTINIDVLANDTSYANSALKILEIVNQPEHGVATIVSNKIRYKANSGYTGTDVFTYSITDVATGQYKDTSNVTVEVSAPTNTAPIANDDSASTLENTQIAVDVLDNDTDAEGDNLVISTVSDVINGQAIISGKYIIYTPNTDFVGTDSVSYSVKDDNGGTASAVLTITVQSLPNSNPVAKDDSASTVGANPKVIDVLANDSDSDGDLLTISNVTLPTNGTVTIVNSSKKVRYVANNSFSGSDSFVYTISDGNGGTDTATVTINVSEPPNNPPDAREDSPAVDFDKTITVDVLANDVDPDGDPLTVLYIVQPSVGTAILNNDGSIFFDPEGNVGSITILYTISDGRGGTDTAALTIASTDPNDGNDAYPDITDEVVSTPKNTPIFIDVLANDSDADGDTLILDQVDQGANGTTIKQNGGVLYTPDSGFTGTDVFYYGVHDGHGHNGSGKVTVTVNP